MEKEIRTDMITAGFRPYLIIAILCAALFGGSLGFGLTYLDDDHLINKNRIYLKDIRNLPSAFTKGVFLDSSNDTFYRPMMTVSLMLDTIVSDGSPHFYRAMNIFLHFIATSLLFIFLRSLGHNKAPSLAFTLLFCCHPVLTAAVVWIPGRNDTLAALFTLLSLLAFLKYMKAPRFSVLSASFVLFLAALLTKETASAAILAAAALPFALGRKPKPIFNYLSILICWFAALIIWLLLRSSFTAQMFPLPELAGFALRNSGAALLYLGKMVFPWGLTALPVMNTAGAIQGIAAIASLTVLFVLFRPKRISMFLFGALWLGVFLLPGLAIPDRFTLPFFIEHRAYLPIAGLIIMLMECDLSKISIKGRNISFEVYLLILVIFCMISFSYQQVYSGAFQFWKNAAANSPGLAMARSSFGYQAFLSGDLGLAESEINTALLISPSVMKANNNLGLVYASRGDLSSAERYFRKELAMYPDNTDALFNLGLACGNRGNIDEAIRHWEKLIAIAPGYENAGENLITAYLMKGNTRKAAELAKSLMRSGKDLPPALRSRLSMFL